MHPYISRKIYKVSNQSMRLDLWYFIGDVEYLVQLEILNFKKLLYIL